MDPEELLVSNVAALILGLKGYAFLEGHRHNPCQQCGAASIAATNFGMDEAVAMRLTCLGVQNAVRHIGEAFEAIKWFGK